MFIEKRYRTKRKIENPHHDIYEGHDIVQHCDIVLIKIDALADCSKSQTTQLSEGAPSISMPDGILTPSRIIEDNRGCFAIIPLPKGTMLQKNIEMMNKIDKPFQEGEIIRIGRLLCELAAKATSHNLKPVISPDLVFIAVDGTPSIIALDPKQINISSDSHIEPPLNTVAILLQEMANAGRKKTSFTTGEKGLMISPNLKKVLSLVSSGSGQIDNLNDFAIAIGQQTEDHRYLKSITLLCLIILMFIAAIVLYRLDKHFDLLKQDEAITNFRLATENLQSQAHEAAKDLAILTASEHIRSTQQATDAKFLLSTGDEYLAAREFEKAQLAYKDAIVLYKAAIRHGKEIVKLRTENQKSRELARLSQSRWLPLLGSNYIQIPDQINKAADTAFEGEAQALRGNYREAIFAFQLAAQLYDAMPPEEYNELLYHHESLAAREQASIAANSWEKIHTSMGLKSSKSANRAKEQMAIGEGLLKAGQYEQAAKVFTACATLFENATKSAIEGMAARVAADNAQENAIQAFKDWQSLFKSMKMNSEPTEILEAKQSLKKARHFISQKKYRPSIENYEHATSLFEHHTRRLVAEAEGLAQKAADQAKQVMNSLAVSQKDLENRLNKARENFKKLQTQIPRDHNSANHQQLLDEYANARKHYQLINKTMNHCNATVYGGNANKKARAMYAKGNTLSGKGEYVEAHRMYKATASEFAALAKLPNAIEKYFNTEEKVLESKKTIMGAIGPIAGKLSEIQKLLGLVDTSIANANTLLHKKELAKANLSLEDARLALDSLLPQAEVELFNHALKADSELRREIAMASLEELIVINPAHFRARKLLTKIQSTKRSTKRLSIINGVIRNDGKVIPSNPTERTLINVLGKPSRVRANHAGLIFDELGIVATPDPTTNKIISIVVYYAQPLYKSEPKKFYSGTVEIAGIPIGRDDAIEKINKSLDQMQFKPTKIGNTFKATQGDLRILVNYKHRNSQIYSIGILFIKAGGRQS